MCWDPANIFGGCRPKTKSGPDPEIFWVGSKENKGDEVPVGSIAAGDRLSLNSYHGHRFLFRDPTNGNSILGDYVVNAEKASSGEQQHIVPYYGEL